MDYKNKVELIGYYGGDELHACSAWTSTSRDLDDAKRERIPAMLKTLAEAGHHTPFEKSSLHFLVDSDIASHIHLLKHRVGVSINAESARYKELTDKWYLPKDWADVLVTKTELNKEHQNNRVYGQIAEWAAMDLDWQSLLDSYVEQGHQLYHEAIKQLTPKLGRKRAKESARFFFPYAKQLDFDMQMSFEAFINV
jgi:thymidylate synthase ThyX